MALTGLNHTCTVKNLERIVSIRSSTFVNRGAAVMNRSGAVDISCKHRRSIVRHNNCCWFLIPMNLDLTVLLKSG